MNAMVAVVKKNPDKLCVCMEPRPLNNFVIFFFLSVGSFLAWVLTSRSLLPFGHLYRVKFIYFFITIVTE